MSPGKLGKNNSDATTQRREDRTTMGCGLRTGSGVEQIWPTMASGISTVTSKWQVTVPEDARREIPVKAGQRVRWEAKDGYWEVRPIPDLDSLSGCLKTDRPPLTDAALRALIRP